jgi:hypothetical protein
MARCIVIGKSTRQVVFGYLNASIQSLNGRLRIIYTACPNVVRRILSYKKYNMILCYHSPSSICTIVQSEGIFLVFC